MFNAFLLDLKKMTSPPCAKSTISSDQLMMEESKDCNMIPMDPCLIIQGLRGWIFQISRLSSDGQRCTVALLTTSVEVGLLQKPQSPRGCQTNPLLPTPPPASSCSSGCRCVASDVQMFVDKCPRWWARHGPWAATPAGRVSSSQG